jgi:hypothetical protein
MNRLVLDPVPTAAQAGHIAVTLRHLCREVVVADRNIAHYMRHMQWDLAEAWTDYREDIQLWRYIALRHERPLPQLEVCPQCGRVQEMVGRTGRCQACGWQWDMAPPLPAAPGESDV